MTQAQDFGLAKACISLLLSVGMHQLDNTKPKPSAAIPLPNVFRNIQNMECPMIVTLGSSSSFVDLFIDGSDCQTCAEEVIPTNG